MSIKLNLTRVIENINTAVTNRNPQLNISANVKLVAVTKNHTVTAIREAIAAGAAAIGENRVQEALGKYQEMNDCKVEWHLIGHLQTNKVRQAVPIFDLIHSVDSEHLAVEINRIAGKIGKRQDVLIQVNVADEDSKFGISPQTIISLGRFISDLEHVRLCGLMTIAPFFEEPESARPVFKELFQLFMNLKSCNLANTNLQWLSMGMTNDYIIAVEEGANLVRVGTGIFGARQY